MAVVQGIKEKVHLPIYDSILIEPGKQLRDVEKSNILKFFVNVQNKTKLETNLQAASLLPHYNTFEARAMRVVISDLPPAFSKEVIAESENLPVTDEEGNDMDHAGAVKGDPNTGTFDPNNAVEGDVEIPLDRLIELLKEAKDDADGFASLPVDDTELVPELRAGGNPLPDTGSNSRETVADAGGVIRLSKADIQSLIDDLKDVERPLKEQIDRTNGSGTLIGKIVYNTVTSLYVGEKVMIQVPTFFFPGGAGPYSEAAKVTTHGEPSPLATFRFAEPIYIDRQQNFRVEIETPDSDAMKELQRIYGPFYIWVFLDGYMTRDVQ
jgi:hypothetical protein